jgi:hypothetical protein
VVAATSYTRLDLHLSFKTPNSHSLFLRSLPPH